MTDKLYSPRSVGNKLIVESYQKEGLKSSVSNGFAFVEQKVMLKGLKVLVDAYLSDGTHIPVGSLAYIKEEELHTKPWAQKILQCDALSQTFIVVDLSNVEFIAPPKWTE